MVTTKKGTTKKLLEIDVKHQEWIKRTAKELGIYEKEVVMAALEYAMNNNVMRQYKQKVVSSQLERTLDQLSSQAKAIAELQEKAEGQLRSLQKTDGEQK